MTTRQLAAWTVPVIAFSISTLIALGVRQLLLQVLAARMPRTWRGKQLLLDAVRGPSVLWCLAAGLAIAIQAAETHPTFDLWAQRSIAAFTIISIGLAVATIAVKLVVVYGERKSLRIAGLSQTLIYVFIFSIVLLMVLSEFHVEITPILTALGVGGLAVALALQDTLSNFFAGIHILIEEPIRVGDFIRLTKDEEGTVTDIGWRTTRIQTSQNSIIVIPNKNLVSANVVNFHLPVPRVSTEVQILAAHGASPDLIVESALEIAANTEAVLKDPPPAVVFDPGVLATHLQIKLVVHVASVFDRGRVQSALRAQLHRAFLEKGIPFPEIPK
jgi:small-conductance mechanosensitive channel